MGVMKRENSMKIIQRLQIAFYLNDTYIEAVVDPDLRAIDFIRDQRLTGTKESCSEGDCGACTIALGQLEKNKIIYRAVASCILPIAKLHGSHVVTIEGLNLDEKLHVISQALVTHHAIQCGYCTPGMVMSLFCLFANNPAPASEDILSALEGNLCRCTGYQTILSAASAVKKLLATSDVKKILYPTYFNKMARQLKTLPARAVQGEKVKTEEARTQQYLVPATLKELLKYTQQYKKNYALIAGGSDVMVAANLRDQHAPCLIDVTAIPELDGISKEGRMIFVGARVTMAALAKHPLVARHLPVLREALQITASQQIRNVATLVGNIANASPVGDGACVLLGLGATLHLQSPLKKRDVFLENFYLGYKKVDLKRGEIITGISIPISARFCRFEKTSKRKAVDISSVSSCLAVTLDAARTVIACRFAFGGVAAYPILALRGMHYLVGKKLNSEMVQTVARMISQEFKPLTDVRGSAKFRTTLIRNHVVKQMTVALDRQ
jgi:xanthine dehydrogenase small subunit